MHNSILDAQFGFKKGSSTVDAIFSLVTVLFASLYCSVLYSVQANYMHLENCFPLSIILA